MAFWCVRHSINFVGYDERKGNIYHVCMYMCVLCEWVKKSGFGIPLFYPRQFHFWWCDNEQWTLNLIRSTSVSLFAGQIKHFTISCVRVPMCNKVVLPNILSFRTITIHHPMQIYVYFFLHFGAGKRSFSNISFKFFQSTFDRFYRSTIRNTLSMTKKKWWEVVDQNFIDV